jgi:hypothetical protein
VNEIDCTEARKKLKEYAAGTIREKEQVLLMELHISGCELCKRELLLWQEVMDKQRAVGAMQAGMPEDLRGRVKYRIDKSAREAAVPPVVNRMKAMAGLFSSARGRLVILSALIFGALIFILQNAYAGKSFLTPLLFGFGFFVLLLLVIFKNKK